jgi:hypothetical protein
MNIFFLGKGTKKVNPNLYTAILHRILSLQAYGTYELIKSTPKVLIAIHGATDQQLMS